MLLEVLPLPAALLSGLPLVTGDLRFVHDWYHFDRKDSAFDMGSRDSADMVLVFVLGFLAKLSIMCTACLCG